MFLPCTHQLHNKCFDALCNQRIKYCPICKHDFSEYFDIEEEDEVEDVDALLERLGLGDVSDDLDDPGITFKWKGGWYTIEEAEL